MRVVAFRCDNIVAHDYGGGDMVLWQRSKRDPFVSTGILVDSVKLERQLRKFNKRKRKARG